jgi:hypothetical protein
MRRQMAVLPEFAYAILTKPYSEGEGDVSLQSAPDAYNEDATPFILTKANARGSLGLGKVGRMRIMACPQELKADHRVIRLDQIDAVTVPAIVRFYTGPN